jgi:Zinc finger, C3HC4 type (RING finger)
MSSSSSKLEVEILSPHNDLEDVGTPEPIQEDSEDSCSICLHSIADRTVIPKCSHEFCFECLLVWTGMSLPRLIPTVPHFSKEQSRRCPLCSQTIGEYLIHSIRSRYDYRKHYLPSLRTSPLPSHPAQTNAVLRTTRQRRRREREWGTRARESDEADKLERSIAKRRWIYRHDLYAKVCLSFLRSSLFFLLTFQSTLHPMLTQNIAHILQLPNSLHLKILYHVRQHFYEENYKFGKVWMSR